MLEVRLEGRGSLPGGPRPAVPPWPPLTQTLFRASQAPACSPRLWRGGAAAERILIPSGPTWRAVGRSAKAACPPTQSLSPSISLPSALTGLASHPISPKWGKAGKGVIRSCPPLHLFPPHPPKLIPYPGLLSPQMVNFPPGAFTPHQTLF